MGVELGKVLKKAILPELQNNEGLGTMVLPISSSITIVLSAEDEFFSYIYGWTLEELTDWLAQQNQPAFRAKQIWKWLYEQAVTEWDQMLNLPVAL